MATNFIKCSWADMQEEYESELESQNSASPSTSPTFSSTTFSPKLSYLAIVSKGVVMANNPLENNQVDENPCDPNDGFTLVCKKKQIKKCENAVLQWAKNKSTTDEEIICVRCALPFLFNKHMKQRYNERGWKVPKVCKVCSQIRYEDRKKVY